MRQKGLTEMKNDSNMFNDNSIETEGVQADKTAEITKVVDSMEEENAKKPLVLFGREFSRKQVCVAGAGILCAALLIGGGAYAISHASWTGDSNAPAVSQSKDEEKQDMVLTLEVKADGWDADTSTPVIAHIEDADGKVDFYIAIAANKQVTVEVGKSGTYTVTLIPPVNAVPSQTSTFRWLRRLREKSGGNRRGGRKPSTFTPPLRRCLQAGEKKDPMPSSSTRTSTPLPTADVSASAKTSPASRPSKI